MHINQTPTRSAPGLLGSLATSPYVAAPDPRISFFLQTAPDQPGYNNRSISVYCFLVTQYPTGSHRLDTKALDRVMAKPCRMTRWRYLSWLKKNGWIDIVRGINQADPATVNVLTQGFDLAHLAPAVQVIENLATRPNVTPTVLNVTPEFLNVTPENLNVTPDAKFYSDSVTTSVSGVTSVEVPAQDSVHLYQHRTPENENSGVTFGGYKGGAGSASDPAGVRGPAREEKKSTPAAAAADYPRGVASSTESANVGEVAAAAADFSDEKNQAGNESYQARENQLDSDTPSMQNLASQRPTPPTPSPSWQPPVNDPLHPAYYQPEEYVNGRGDNRLRQACMAYYHKYPQHYPIAMYTRFIERWTQRVKDQGYQESWYTMDSFEVPLRLANWHERGTAAARKR